MVAYALNLGFLGDFGVVTLVDIMS